MPTPPLSQAKRSQVERLIRLGGLSFETVARRAGVSHGTVSRIAAELGLGGRKGKRKAETRKKVHEELRTGGSFAEVSRRTGIPASTVQSHAGQPLTDSQPLPFPDAVRREWTPFAIDTPGHWLVISDLHVPCHDRTTIELAVRQAKRDGAVGVLLNGDVVDHHELSTHDKDPSLPRYVEEVRLGRELLAWLRAEFPSHRIVYKSGNHEARIQRYIAARAPAIEALEGVSLASVLRFADHGVEGVDDATVIRMGKLNVIHGHEYRGGGGVNPARWLYLKARSVALTSHFHRTSEHHAKDISGKHEAAWSIGCACDLHPRYAILNEWNLGFAMVHLDRDGSFWVRNHRVLDGKVI
jgi:predicted phosphodiesterase